MIRRTAIAEVQAGSSLARPVYNQRGTLVIPVGTQLNEGHLRRLGETGVREVFIDDPSIPEVEIHEPISEATKALAVEVLKDLFDRAAAGTLKAGLGPLYNKISQVVKDIQDDLAEKRNRVTSPIVDIEGVDYLVAHTLSVTVLAMDVARHGNFAPKVFDLGLGALLHDLGMAAVPPDLRHKPEPLSPEERQVVHRHPQEGLRLIEETPALSAFTKVVVLQHHERASGNGYPKGLKLKDIYPLARLMAIVDGYSAFLSDRSHRERSTPQRAMDYVVSSAGFDFDFDLTQEFAQRVAPYPVGTLVTLSTGERGVVVEVRDRVVTRPLVRVFTDPSGAATGRFTDVNLSAPEHQTTMIVDSGQG
ncbi:MAG: HD-GYP domain-containing protein [Bacillota bacterium]